MCFQYVSQLTGVPCSRYVPGCFQCMRGCRGGRYAWKSLCGPRDHLRNHPSLGHGSMSGHFGYVAKRMMCARYAPRVQSLLASSSWFQLPVFLISSFGMRGSPCSWHARTSMFQGLRSHPVPDMFRNFGKQCANVSGT